MEKSKEVFNVLGKVVLDDGATAEVIDGLYAKCERLVELMKEANSLADELASKDWFLPLTVGIESSPAGVAMWTRS